MNDDGREWFAEVNRVKGVKGEMGRESEAVVSKKM